MTKLQLIVELYHILLNQRQVVLLEVFFILKKTLVQVVKVGFLRTLSSKSLFPLIIDEKDIMMWNKCIERFIGNCASFGAHQIDEDHKS
jgi:hypothetical protein